MNSTAPSNPMEKRMPPCINRPAWYLPALWLNPVITWGLLLSIFTFTPLTQKLLWLDTEVDPRFGVLEEILRGQHSPYEIEGPRSFVPVGQRDAFHTLLRERDWTPAESMPADKAVTAASSGAGVEKQRASYLVNSPAGQSNGNVRLEKYGRERVASRGHSPHNSN